MAALEAIVSAKLGQNVQKGPSRKRLVADPMVSVQDLKEVIMLHCSWKDSKKLYDLVCPGESGPRLLGWQTRPHPMYMYKMAGLCFDILKLAPNTKLMSNKLIMAIKTLIGSHIENSTKKSDTEFSETCDQMIRIALSMYRTVKRDKEFYSATCRALPKDHMLKVQVVLDKITLPTDYLEVEEEGQSPHAVYNATYHGREIPKSPTIPASWGETPAGEWDSGWESGVAALGFPTERLGEQSSKTTKSDSPTPASTPKPEPLGTEALGFPAAFLQVPTPSEPLALVPVPPVPRSSPTSATSKVTAVGSSPNLHEQVHDESSNDEQLLAEALVYKAEESKTPKKKSGKVKKDTLKPKSEKKVKMPKDADKIAKLDKFNLDKFKVSSIDLRSG